MLKHFLNGGRRQVKNPRTHFRIHWTFECTLVADPQFHFFILIAFSRAIYQGQ